MSQNVSIDNFSTSWNDGVAFLALIHHFYPDSFNWEKVDPRRRRENFQLAFDLAEYVSLQTSLFAAVLVLT